MKDASVRAEISRVVDRCDDLIRRLCVVEDAVWALRKAKLAKKAQKCPVCDGLGVKFKEKFLVPRGSKDLGAVCEIPAGTTPQVMRVPTDEACQGCGGKGWVVVWRVKETPG